MSKTWPESTFVHAPEGQHAHGAHWESFMDEVMVLVHRLP